VFLQDIAPAHRDRFTVTLLCRVTP